MPLLCGTARADVTPSAALLASGAICTAGFWYERTLPMSAVRDPLSARVCCLRSDSADMALISWESLGDGVGMTARVRAALELGGAAGMRLFLACTHSHTVPDTINLSGRALPEPYLDAVARRIAGAVSEARRNAVPVTRVTVRRAGAADLILNRRPLLRDGRLAVLESAPDPAEVAEPGVVDDRLTAVCIAGRGGSPLAQIVHWACHPVSMQAQPLVSPGFPGLLSRLLEDPAAGGAPSLFLNGASGDVNPRRMGRWEDAEALARELSARISAVESSPAETFVPQGQDLAFAEESVAARRRPVNTAELPPAEGPRAGPAGGAAPERADAEWRHGGAGWRAFVAEQARRVAALPETLAVPLCALRLGPIVLAGAGGELFAEFGLRLRAADPARIVLPVSCVNAYAGYLAPRRAYQLGGYETECAPWCPLAPGEAERVVAACARLTCRSAGV